MSSRPKPSKRPVEILQAGKPKSARSWKLAPEASALMIKILADAQAEANRIRSEALAKVSALCDLQIAQLIPEAERPAKWELSEDRTELREVLARPPQP